ncbi:hypothetical protein SKAU_G00252330 [Synaphobranchus kaupii]|uniref:Uncharacterized protein n=1 Tax=Synaphobranchus kaupii TaxID=118154 RepID=A0A9Q1F343_SYNKA|nr:hypothetical protein SKAU_G00252330 [Synaphobranchus kaupii]
MPGYSALSTPSFDIPPFPRHGKAAAGRGSARAGAGPRGGNAGESERRCPELPCRPRGTRRVKCQRDQSHGLRTRGPKTPHLCRVAGGDGSTSCIQSTESRDKGSAN